MSNFNYMDNVPVKISENYRPLPRVYQLPQAIAHKLALPTNHYETAAQYQYDFQLEHILLQKLPEWRHVRQRDKDARRERMQRRQQQQQREFEAEQKQLLGAVSYPSAEDLSSCSSDEQDTDENKFKTTATKPNVNTNFNNILQPTILMPDTANGDYLPIKSSSSMTLSKSFNYQDFEGSSSPFDEIELKTINDLDILAQVLHNTQLKSMEEEKQCEKPVDSVSTKEMVVPTTSITNIPSTTSEIDIVASHLPTLTFSNPPLNGIKNTIPPYYDFTNCKQFNNSSANLTTKCVPDILKVLNEETRKSQIYNEATVTNNDKEEEEEEAALTYYEQLEESTKNLVKNISTMGFSLEQVSRIALLYGTDDKKIIEHLISLNELTVLGFTEEHISDALLKCENNKDKALQLLIS